VPVQKLGQSGPYGLALNFRLLSIRNSIVPAYSKRFYMVHFCEFFNVNLDNIDCASYLSLMALPYIVAIVSVALIVECSKLTNGR
jgi:hypothetical protein